MGDFMTKICIKRSASHLHYSVSLRDSQRAIYIYCNIQKLSNKMSCKQIILIVLLGLVCGGSCSEQQSSPEHPQAHSRVAHFGHGWSPQLAPQWRKLRGEIAEKDGPVDNHKPSSDYKYMYRVGDKHTGDLKMVGEYKEGDITRGHYSYLKPDGIWLTVDYFAHPVTGFTSIVKNQWRAGGEPPKNDKKTYGSAPRFPGPVGMHLEKDVEVDVVV